MQQLERGLECRLEPSVDIVVDHVWKRTRIMFQSKKRRYNRTTHTVPKQNYLKTANPSRIENLRLNSRRSLPRHALRRLTLHRDHLSHCSRSCRSPPSSFLVELFQESVGECGSRSGVLARHLE